MLSIVVQIDLKVESSDTIHSLCSLCALSTKLEVQVESDFK